MYMLNLLFDFNDTEGRFTGDRGNTPLLKSRNWLVLNDPEPANPAAFDPETARWTDLGEADTLLVPSAPDPGSICVRIAPDPTAAAFPNFDPATATLQLVLAFGVPARARQRFASPFTTDGRPGGPTKSTFVLGPIRRNTTVGWFMVLGKIVNKPINPRLTHRYEFALGTIVTTGNGAAVHHYGDDPEMDIGA